MDDVERTLELFESRKQLWRTQYEERKKRIEEEYERRLVEIEEAHKKAVRKIELAFCVRKKSVEVQYGGKSTCTTLHQVSDVDSVPSTSSCNTNSVHSTAVANRPRSAQSSKMSYKMPSLDYAVVPPVIIPETASFETACSKDQNDAVIMKTISEGVDDSGSLLIVFNCIDNHINTRNDIQQRNGLRKLQMSAPIVNAAKHTGRFLKYVGVNRCERSFGMSRFSADFVVFDPGGNNTLVVVNKTVIYRREKHTQKATTAMEILCFYNATCKCCVKVVVPRCWR